MNIKPVKIIDECDASLIVIVNRLSPNFPNPRHIK